MERTEYFLSKKVGKATMDYEMIQNGDNVLVAVSGKDSASLLKILNDRRSFVPIKYGLLAVYVDLGFSEKNRKVIGDYLKVKGYDYLIESVDLGEGKKNGLKKSPCFWCSWKRRERLFKTAVKFGCNKIALGHHMDDILETLLLNMFFLGEISTMNPNQDMFSGKLHIIRPLVYIEEYALEKFAKGIGFPALEPCSQKDRTNRALMRELLKEVQKRHSKAKRNLFRSLNRLKIEYLLSKPTVKGKSDKSDKSFKFLFREKLGLCSLENLRQN